MQHPLCIMYTISGNSDDANNAASTASTASTAMEDSSKDAETDSAAISANEKNNPVDSET